MLERFVEAFPPDAEDPTAPPSQHPDLLAVPAYAEVARVLGTRGHGGGRIRLLDEAAAGEAREVIATAFPGHAATSVPFARDWLGRVYALDQRRMVGGQPLISLVELGVARVLQVDHALAGFFDDALVDDPDLYLEGDLHREWKAAGGADPGARECASFIRPPFMNGEFVAANLEISDLSVHWGVTAQLIEAVRALPPGTTLGGVSITD